MNENSRISPDIASAAKILIQYKREKRELEARLMKEGEVWKNV